MPSAEQFRQYAHQLRGLHVDLDATSTIGAADLTGVFQGGGIAPIVEGGLRVAASTVELLRGEIDLLAGICDNRAEICDGFVEELRAWELRYDEWYEGLQKFYSYKDVPTVYAPWPGAKPARPVPAFDWVEPR